MTLQSVGHKFVEELRGKDLSQIDWAILMIDGIRLSKDLLAVVAVGITTEGYKHVLDFDLGSTENAEVCRSLLRRLMGEAFAVTADCWRFSTVVRRSRKLSKSSFPTFWFNVSFHKTFVKSIKRRNVNCFPHYLTTP